MTKEQVMETMEFNRSYEQMKFKMNEHIEDIKEYKLYEYKYVEDYVNPNGPGYGDILYKKHIFNYEVIAPNVKERTYTIKIKG